MFKTAISLFVFCMALTVAQGQSVSITKIDSILTEMTRQDLFSGAVLIAEGPKILLSKGYGYSDRENKVKNTPDTRFDLSSGSKIFTGTAITCLAQQGKLKFTDTIGQYIKGLPKGNVITLHEVLTHSSGFDDFYKAPGFSYDKVKNCTDIIPFMQKLPLVYEPGDSCIYSTGNAILLGAVVEKITGTDFRDYVEQTFLEPLKLENTCFTPYWTLTESQRQFAIGYKKNKEKGYSRCEYNYDRGFIPLSAGGAWSSVNDLFAFDQAVFSGRILNKEFLARMTTAWTGPLWGSSYFGYIWIVDLTHTPCIGHAGNSSGWNTWNYYYPGKKITMIILTNFGSVDVFKLSALFDKLIFR
jgi:CubicO group peptidase (beta-lactamase class C family)